MEARPLCALIALAMLVGQVAGFSQFPGGAPEEEGRSSRSSADPGVDVHQLRKSLGLAGVDGLPWPKGGATGCSYMRPSGKTGCPILASGCIEPPPVAGQCAIFKTDIESVCGGDPMCGGVVCKPEYQFGGKEYCLARWGIDPRKTDSGWKKGPCRTLSSNELEERMEKGTYCWDDCPAGCRTWEKASRRYAYRRREAVRNYQGGATGCSYMSPGGCRAAGCPILASGCIEPPPVPGQCAIYEDDVVSVCGGDPICGGVVCSEDYKHNGKQYCLARWGIDESESDSRPSDGAALVAAGRRCGTQAKNLGTTLYSANYHGTTFSTPYQCGEAAAADASCGSTFQYPRSAKTSAELTRRWQELLYGVGDTWECACCVGNGEGGSADSNWDVYAVPSRATPRWAIAFDAMTTDGFPGGQPCTSFKPTIPRFDAAQRSYMWCTSDPSYKCSFGGATGCSYGSPGDGCRPTGCPILASGCIEPPPVAGQCAIFKTDVESVCGGDPICGGVVCREDYKHNGKQYCLARWAIDEKRTDDRRSSYTMPCSCTIIRGLEPGPLPAATPPRPARYTDRAPPRRRSEARDGRQGAARQPTGSSGHCMCVRGAGRSRHGVNHRPARG